MDNKELEKKLADIETRLARIETQFKIPPAATTKSPYQFPATERVEKKVTDVKATESSGNWLGIIAIICFILAAAFIIKLSIDTGWLTPAKQVGLAFVFGLSLILAGLLLLKRDREYASFLPATGVIILYLSTFAAHQYYYLIQFETGIVITSLVSVLCIFLYWRIRHDLYALTAVAGAYLGPIILDFHAAAAFSLYYFLVCSIAFAVLSIWVRSRKLIIVAAYLAIGASAYIGTHINNNQLLAAILPIHFIIFSLGAYFFSRHTRQSLTENEAWAHFPVLVFFYAMEYYFIYQFAPQSAPWISITFAVFLLALYLLAKNMWRKQVLASEPVVFAFVTIVLFHSFYLELLPDDARPWIFVAIFLGLSFLPVRNLQSNTNYTIPIIGILLILLIQYMVLLSKLLNEPVHTSLTALLIASFASIWIFILKQHQFVTKKNELHYGILGVAHLLAVTGLYHLTTDISSLAVSASWLLYAVAVMAFAYERKDKIMARSALFVLSFAAAKALLYDAAAAPTLVRIFCLLLTGLVLYGAGFLMRKITSWKD